MTGSARGGAAVPEVSAWPTPWQLVDDQRGSAVMAENRAPVALDVAELLRRIADRRESDLHRVAPDIGTTHRFGGACASTSGRGFGTALPSSCCSVGEKASGGQIAVSSAKAESPFRKGESTGWDLLHTEPPAEPGAQRDTPEGSLSFNGPREQTCN